MTTRSAVTAPSADPVYERRTFRCAHGHEWEMLHGDCRRCPTCGTITFEATNLPALAARGGAR